MNQQVFLNMNIDKLNNVIATRKLGTKTGEEIRVSIGQPEAFDDGEYYCPYSIDCIGAKVEYSYSCGVDAIQALQLCMKKIGTDLQFKIGNGREIFWLDYKSGDLGFPEC